MDTPQPPSDNPSLVDGRSMTLLPASFPDRRDVLPPGVLAGAHPTDSREDSVVFSNDSFNPWKLNREEALNTQDSQAALARGFDDVEQQPVKRSTRRRLLLVVVCALLIVAGVALGVYFGIVRPNSRTNRSSAPPRDPAASSSVPSHSPTTNPTILYGGDGTEITTEQGVTFTYKNQFGGYFVQDSSNPFNNDAVAQSYTPPLNTTWDWSKDQVLGSADGLIPPLSLGADLSTQREPWWLACAGTIHHTYVLPEIYDCR